MVKKTMLIAALALGVSGVRANTLETEFRRVCAEAGMESRDMPIEMVGCGDDNIDTFVMAQVTTETSAKVKTALSLIPAEKIWMTVDESGEGLSLYGEELPSDKIGLLMLIDRDGSQMLMYIGGDKDLVRHINLI